MGASGTAGRGASTNGASVSEASATETGKAVAQPAESEKPRLRSPDDLTPEQEKQVQELKQRDQEVRAHEQAHATVGGSYASAPSYEYTVGPDGKRYAIGGEVQIDASPVRDNPEATIRKMEIVIRAALAPAEPSPQDLAVARSAQQTRMQAQRELNARSLEEARGGGDDDQAPGSGEIDPAFARAIDAYQQAQEAAAALFG